MNPVRFGAPLWRQENLTGVQPSVYRFNHQAFLLELAENPFFTKRHITAPRELAKRHLNSSQTMKSQSRRFDETKVAFGHSSQGHVQRTIRHQESPHRIFFPPTIALSHSESFLSTTVRAVSWDITSLLCVCKQQSIQLLFHRTEKCL